MTPSNDSQSVTFTLEISGLVELHIINKGLSGTFDYDIMIRENISTTTCKGTSVYENNAGMTMESDSIMHVHTTLVGKRYWVQKRLYYTQ